MRTFIAVVCPTETRAYEAARTLRRLHNNRTITLHELVVIERQADGEVAVRESSERPLARTGVGAVLGGIAGALGGPPGVLFGIAGGGLAGVIDDTVHGAVDDEYVADIAAQLAPGTFAVLAQIRETDPAVIDVRMAEHGVQVLRQTRREHFAAMIDERVQAHRAARVETRVERASAAAVTHARWLDADAHDARDRLQRTTEDVQARLTETASELRGEIAALEAQLAKASPDVRDAIAVRLAATRRDLEARERALAGALALATDALRA